MLIKKLYNWYYNKHLSLFKETYPNQSIRHAVLFNQITYDNTIHTLAVFIVTTDGNHFISGRTLLERDECFVSLDNVLSSNLHNTFLGLDVNVIVKNNKLQCRYPEHGDISETINYLISSQSKTTRHMKRDWSFKRKLRFSLLPPTILASILANFVRENPTFTLLFVALSAVLPDYIKEDLFEYVGLGETEIDIAKKVV